jgi:acyl-CoA thioester hydrolase
LLFFIKKNNMQKNKLVFPNTVQFECTLPILIQHINYGNHVGNDSLVSLIHEARVQYLHSLGFTELRIGNVGLLLKSLEVQFKKQLFYGDVLLVQVSATEFTNTSFTIYYNFLNKNKENQIALTAKTEMVCYDYTAQKVALVPKEFVEKII